MKNCNTTITIKIAYGSGWLLAAVVLPSRQTSANIPVVFGRAISTPSLTAQARKKQKGGKGSLVVSERKEKGTGGALAESVLKVSLGSERKMAQARQTPVNSSTHPGALDPTTLVNSEDEGEHGGINSSGIARV